MASFNKLTIVGYLGRDPELKHTPQGNAVCKFSVATTERRKDAEGEYQDHTTWFRITVWGRQAELCNEYLAKGRQVYIEGRLRLEEYQDRDGHTRTSAEVTASDVQFIGPSKDAPAAAPASNPQEKQQRAAALGSHTQPSRSKSTPKQQALPTGGTNSAYERGALGIDDDEIPF